MTPGPELRLEGEKKKRKVRRKTQDKKTNKPTRTPLRNINIHLTQAGFLLERAEGARYISIRITAPGCLTFLYSHPVFLAACFLINTACHTGQ